MATTRFTDQERNTAPVSTDGLAGFKADGTDARYTFVDVAEAMKVLLAPYLLTPEERETIEEPPPAISILRRFYRGATAPAVNVNDADPGPDWLTSPGTGTDAVWEITATASNGVFVPPWSEPVKISGENGIPGLPGEDGTPGNRYYFQGEQPSDEDRLHNDVWWDTSDNFKQYRWDSETETWIASFQPMLTLDEGGRVTGLVKAGESGKNFVLVAEKFQIWNGTSAYVPFEIIEGVVYIKSAVIRQVAAAAIIGGTITGQEIILSGTGAKIRSNNFVAGVSGWQIDGDGVAEFAGLVVRNSNIEANAVTRRYSATFPNSGLLSAGSWHELGTLAVSVAAGETAVFSVSMGYETSTSEPFATDAQIRLLRADGSQVGITSWTTRQGNTELIHYEFVDTTPTSSYKLELQSAGGTGGGRSINVSAIIYRK